MESFERLSDAEMRELAHEFDTLALGDALTPEEASQRLSGLFNAIYVRGQFRERAGKGGAVWAAPRRCSVAGCRHPAFGQIALALRPHPDGRPRAEETYWFCVQHTPEALGAVRAPFRADGRP